MLVLYHFVTPTVIYENVYFLSAIEYVKILDFFPY